MTDQALGTDELDEALTALDRIASYVSAGPDAFDVSADRQFAPVYLAGLRGAL